MKTIIIYASIYQGNTRKIAEVMAETLNATLLEPEAVELNTLKDYDLIGFGSGIYYGRFYKRLRKFIKRLPVFEDKKAFLFATCGNETPSKSIEKILAKKGYNLVGKFSCFGYNKWFLSRFLNRERKGKPDAEDYQQAREFAESLKK
jgi:flavodoxin